MKYYVTYKVEGRFIAEVEANNLEEAKAKAETRYLEADFGPLQDIDGESIIVENEKGDYLWEK